MAPNSGGAGGLGSRANLVADCTRCFGLCCVALPFTASAEFAIDKPANEPCPHLAHDFRCGIHSRLRAEGFPGCTVYDCFGAGQQVSQVTFGGDDWRRDPGAARRMFDVFPIMRHLHELLWYLTGSLALPTSQPLRTELTHAVRHVRDLTAMTAESLLAVDIPSLRQEVNALLVKVSELARAGVTGGRKDWRGADLICANLRRVDLRGSSLRGALLVAADLTGADLRRADVTGADFRNADLSGADLAECLFLVQSQLDSARGDASTKIPTWSRRPDHWRTRSI